MYIYTYLERHGSVFQTNRLLPPIEKVAVVDDIGAKVRVSHEARVVHAEVVLLGPDKPVAQTGFPGSLSGHTGKTGRGEAANGHVDDRRFLGIGCH